MSYELYQELAANVERSAKPGYGTIFYFRELEKFDSIAEAPTSITEQGDTRKITGTHTFLDAGDGFIKASGHQTGIEMEGESQGEAGFMGQQPYKAKIFLVGDKAALREKVENMVNRSYLVLFKDPNCADTRTFQLGCDCDPALVSGYKFMSGNRKTGGKKGYELTFESSCLFDYEGTITLKDVTS